MTQIIWEAVFGIVFLLAVLIAIGTFAERVQP